MNMLAVTPKDPTKKIDLPGLFGGKVSYKVGGYVGRGETGFIIETEATMEQLQEIAGDPVTVSDVGYGL